MVDDSRMDEELLRLYGTEALADQKLRWIRLIELFHYRFGTAEVRCFRAPGRTEIGGNHTDHNRGKVLAAAVNLDTIAVALRTDDDTITMHSEGYGRPIVVALNELSPVAAERGRTEALVRGVAARFRQLGFNAGGFRVCVTSDVSVGSGLSSSASFEMLVATILNSLYNAGAVDELLMAHIAHYAENLYFGKPCGLMDQIACAVGGIVKIDFDDPGKPKIEKLVFRYDAYGFRLLVVDTGGNHADLTEEYASIPREMKAVAAHFGKEVCRQISKADVLNNIAELRTRVGDRAVLRALHFFEENERVDLEAAALLSGDLPEFLKQVRESGTSSHKWLQNCVAFPAAAQQAIPLALALAERYLRASGGACRVHGGGFAGTIQVFLPSPAIADFRAVMEAAFGAGCVKVLHISPYGSEEVML